MNKNNFLSLLSFILPMLSFILSMVIVPFSKGIAVILFFIINIVAIILGICSLIKRKNYNRSSTLLALIGIVMGILWIVFLMFSSVNHPSNTRDPRRESHIRQINLAMDMYYNDNNEKYLQSETLPTSIGIFLNPMPTQPRGGPCSSYQWISNMNNSQRYCVWACLEDGKFFAASPKGTKTLDRAPTDLNCGEETTTDETADWQTYRNEKYGFEFNYPSDFKKIEETNVNDSQLYFSNKDTLIFMDFFLPLERKIENKSLE